jgi:adenosine deaminase
MVDFMKKTELMKEFQELEEEKQVHIDGIVCNSKKSEIQNAIECLKCPDELLDKYLTVVSLKYENTGRVIAENGDFKHHSHNRLYVFNTARQILAS